MCDKEMFHFLVIVFLHHCSTPKNRQDLHPILHYAPRSRRARRGSPKVQRHHRGHRESVLVFFSLLRATAIEAQEHNAAAHRTTAAAASQRRHGDSV